MIRTEDNGILIVPASAGEPVEVRVQGLRLRAEAGANGAEFSIPPLFFGARPEIEGDVWKEKNRTRLMVEKR